MLKHILAGKRLRLTRKTQDIDHILIHYVSTLAQLYRIEEALKRKGKQVNISMYGVDTYNPDLNQQTLRFTNKMCFAIPGKIIEINKDNGDCVVDYEGETREAKILMENINN